MDTQPLGDPLHRQFVPHSEQSVASSNAEAEHINADLIKEQEQQTTGNMRDGDSGLGLPNPQAELKNMRIISELEQNMFVQEEEDLLQRRLEEKLAALRQGGLKIPAPLFRLAFYTLVLLSAVLGLFIIGEGISLYNSLQTMPVTVQYIIAGVAGVFILLILGVIGKLGYSLASLRKTPQINLQALSILQERTELQLLSEKATQEAKEKLYTYLSEYPLDDHAHLYRCGFSREVITALEGYSRRLTDSSRVISAQEWVEEFRDTFQQQLEATARERVKKYAGKVAIGTAASPVGFIDQIIVLYGSLGMIKDILSIYNLRPAFAQSSIVLSRAIMQAYLSGLIGSASESGVESLSETYEEWTGEVFAGSLSSTFKSLFSRTAEAGLNGFLIWRLGRATIKYVEMIKATKK